MKLAFDRLSSHGRAQTHQNQQTVHCIYVAVLSATEQPPTEQPLSYSYLSDGDVYDAILMY